MLKNKHGKNPLLYFQHSTDQHLDWQSGTLQHKNRKHQIPHTLICSQTWEADGRNAALLWCQLTGWPRTSCRWNTPDELDSQNSGFKIMARFSSVCKQPQEDASERQRGGSPGRPPGLGIQICGQVSDGSPHSLRCSSSQDRSCWLSLCSSRGVWIAATQRKQLEFDHFSCLYTYVSIDLSIEMRLKIDRQKDIHTYIYIYIYSYTHTHIWWTYYV